MNTRHLTTPVGELRLIASGTQLLRIEFESQHQRASGTGTGTGTDTSSELLQHCATQLTEYFAAQRALFSLDLATTGTAFQRSVWQSLQRIPYGETRSYRDIARDIGKPTAIRAVGAACRRNPLPIVVPCHRVVGSDGSLTGFVGGLEAKTLLLALENS
ncbi:methylated-DNA--[protein]-cysteine S-methyltransferase [Candidatus Marimicrobium litorale]|uniref:Methylated-DNA--protein-cysteine methyltransferase n=1 Tax=Candidatus Marimicrobium litorale TaxID=2518991 RepID=A0ABT3TAH2_9GAMM|nr:methylated-DNA--[protein]-cysteine S-methyltransferase [Candidatus Marimicrobium litorale]MCX2979039.1 methylated-DNA--[protein]-cysteine S-methyltransferase [Candidatus Marimicrobium litorale]